MADDIVLGARQLTNKQNKYPSYDTERPSFKSLGDTGLSTENYHRDEKPKMNLSNPAKADFIVEKKDHPLAEHFNRKPTARRHFGAGTVTEN